MNTVQYGENIYITRAICDRYTNLNVQDKLVLFKSSTFITLPIAYIVYTETIFKCIKFS